MKPPYALAALALLEVVEVMHELLLHDVLGVVITLATIIAVHVALALDRAE